MISAATYEAAAGQPTDIFEHVPTLRQVTEDVNAQTVIELGVRTGVSTVAFLAAVDSTGGTVWSVDIESPTVPYEVSTHPQWRLIVGNDLALAGYLPTECDVLFIDTSHTYQQTLAELELYGERSKVILLHDTALHRPDASPDSDPDFPVRVAVEEWVDLSVWDVEFRDNCNGLGILRRKP